MIRTLQLETSWGPLTIAGGSRAGEATLILLPQLRLALDPGRPHRALPPMTTAVISHGHLDHLGGLGYWAAQRELNTMGRATVIAPSQIAAEIEDLLTSFARLEGGSLYQVDVLAVDAGDRHAIRADMELEFFSTDHWVPTLGSRLIWSRRRLRKEMHGLDGDEIARRRGAGEEVTERHSLALFSYCADSGPRLFKSYPDAFESEVLLLECSFFRPADRERAKRYGHLHLDDLIAAVADLKCRHLVLLHASRRHRLREVERILSEQLAPALDCQMHHLMVDWE
jgi:ribonuclease Z